MYYFQTVPQPVQLFGYLKRTDFTPTSLTRDAKHLEMILTYASEET